MWYSKHQAGVTRSILGPLLLWVTFILSTSPFTQNLIYFDIYLTTSRSQALLQILSFILLIVN